ncbi:DUF4148 domain-containing protein [Hydrogenophaga sp. OTU3427]|uniref:DUF4148 domain-containing protein n=1 Tax=Hydrogenophaga sp. OTU3427 TaxID=3043856 RepID=UPI00313D80E6
MNRSYVSAIALSLAALSAGNAMALEAGDRGLGLSDDFGRPTTSAASQLTRAQVQAEYQRAAAAGQVAASGDRETRVGTVAQASTSGVSREAVRAEYQRAAAAGEVLPSGDRVVHL